MFPKVCVQRRLYEICSRKGDDVLHVSECYLSSTVMFQRLLFKNGENNRVASNNQDHHHVVRCFNFNPIVVPYSDYCLFCNPMKRDESNQSGADTTQQANAFHPPPQPLSNERR